MGSKHLPVVGVNVASIPAGLSVVAVAAIDGSNANNRRWNGGIGLSNEKLLKILLGEYLGGKYRKLRSITKGPRG